MAKSPFKMNGFSGFGNSPLKQTTGHIDAVGDLLKKLKSKTKTKNGKTKKKKVSKGDVVQTLVAPHINIPKTVKVVKRYTPPKVKKTVKNVIKKGKDIVKKGKDWWKSPA